MHRSECQGGEDEQEDDSVKNDLLDSALFIAFGHWLFVICHWLFDICSYFLFPISPARLASESVAGRSFLFSACPVKFLPSSTNLLLLFNRGFEEDKRSLPSETFLSFV